MKRDSVPSRGKQVDIDDSMFENIPFQYSFRPLLRYISHISISIQIKLQTLFSFRLLARQIGLYLQWSQSSVRILKEVSVPSRGTQVHIKPQFGSAGTIYDLFSSPLEVDRFISEDSMDIDTWNTQVFVPSRGRQVYIRRCYCLVCALDLVTVPSRGRLVYT